MSQPAAYGVSEDTNRLTPEKEAGTPAFEKGLEYTNTDIERIGVKQSNKERWMLTLTIVIAWIAALAFAIGHDRYGVATNGKQIKESIGSALGFGFGGQDSIKSASAALTRGVALSLTIAAGAILTQMAWRIPAQRALTLHQIDKVFQLPKLTSTAHLLFSSLFRYVLPIGLLVICVQLLEVVTVMAPQSLRVASSSVYTQTTNVPSLNLSNTPVTAADIYSGGYVGPSASWTRIVQKVMMAPSQAALTPPAGCENGCKFTLNYTAPTLICRELAASELTPHSANGEAILYYGTSTLWPDPSTEGFLQPHFTNNTNDNSTEYNIRIQWSPFSFDSNTALTASPSSTSGVECDFYDANYTTSVSFDGTAQYLNPEVTSLGAKLRGPLANQDSGCPNVPNADEICWITGVNYRATAEAFSKLILGIMVYNDAGSLLITSGTPNLTPLFNADSTVVGQTSSWSFQPSTSNMSNIIEDMFCNVTLGLIAARQDMANVNVTFTSPGNVWEYDSRVLWDIYGPTLAVFAVFVIFGVWSIWRNGAADSKFSNFLVATRGPGIDRAVSTAKDMDEVRKLRMRYARRGNSAMHGEFEVHSPQDKPEA